MIKAVKKTELFDCIVQKEEGVVSLTNMEVEDIHA